MTTRRDEVQAAAARLRRRALLPNVIATVNDSRAVDAIYPPDRFFGGHSCGTLEDRRLLADELLARYPRDDDMAHLKVPGTDWVVTAFVVHHQEPKVALCLHKKLGCWLGVGGHIELDTADADPDAALARELLEETGLLLGRDAYVYQEPAQRALRRTVNNVLEPDRTNRARAHYVPWFVETHDFAPIPGHYHLALGYLVVATTDRLVLEAEAHHALLWFTRQELDVPGLPTLDTARLYARRAIDVVHPPTVEAPPQSAPEAPPDGQKEVRPVAG